MGNPLKFPEEKDCKVFLRDLNKETNILVFSGRSYEKAVSFDCIYSIKIGHTLHLTD